MLLLYYFWVGEIFPLPWQIIDSEGIRFFFGHSTFTPLSSSTLMLYMGASPVFMTLYRNSVSELLGMKLAFLFPLISLSPYILPSILAVFSIPNSGLSKFTRNPHSPLGCYSIGMYPLFPTSILLPLPVQRLAIPVFSFPVTQNSVGFRVLSFGQSSDHGTSSDHK